MAELYIGFLVGASSNRSERNLEATLGRMSAQEQQIKTQELQINDVETELSASLDQNTQLTQAATNSRRRSTNPSVLRTERHFFLGHVTL